LDELPIAIEPPFSNSRLVAQQGCFTIHGSKPISIDEMTGIGKCLLKIQVDPQYTEIIREELNQLGFNSEWIYQDIDRLSKRIVRERCSS